MDLWFYRILRTHTGYELRFFSYIELSFNLTCATVQKWPIVPFIHIYSIFLQPGTYSINSVTVNISGNLANRDILFMSCNGTSNTMANVADIISSDVDTTDYFHKIQITSEIIIKEVSNSVSPANVVVSLGDQLYNDFSSNVEEFTCIYDYFKKSSNKIRGFIWGYRGPNQTITCQSKLSLLKLFMSNSFIAFSRQKRILQQTISVFMPDDHDTMDGIRHHSNTIRDSPIMLDLANSGRVAFLVFQLPFEFGKDFIFHRTSIVDVLNDVSFTDNYSYQVDNIIMCDSRYFLNGLMNFLQKVQAATNNIFVIQSSTVTYNSIVDQLSVLVGIAYQNDMEPIYRNKLLYRSFLDRIRELSYNNITLIGGDIHLSLSADIFYLGTRVGVTYTTSPSDTSPSHAGYKYKGSHNLNPYRFDTRQVICKKNLLRFTSGTFDFVELKEYGAYIVNSNPPQLYLANDKVPFYGEFINTVAVFSRDSSTMKIHVLYELSNNKLYPPKSIQQYTLDQIGSDTYRLVSLTS